MVLYYEFGTRKASPFPLSRLFRFWECFFYLILSLLKLFHDIVLFLMKFLNLRRHFAAHLLGKSLMIIAGLLTGFVQFSLDLALSLLMGGSPFANS
jgi:hypothetical protein